MGPNVSAIEKYHRMSTASLLCIGLDSDFQRLPEQFQTARHPQFAFNQWIIEQTADFAAAFKPNLAFYEARGAVGWDELALTMAYLREQHPHIVTIADAKRADIGNSNRGYVKAIFDDLGFDAITLHPYMGGATLHPFLERDDKACIILCRTSAPGSGELQDLRMGDKPIWQIVAERVRDEWNANDNCMLVVGATAPNELKIARQVVGEMPILVPGIGAQGGDLAATLANGLTPSGSGLLISSSRGIVFDENPHEAAKRLHSQIESLR